MTRVLEVGRTSQHQNSFFKEFAWEIKAGQNQHLLDRRATHGFDHVPRYRNVFAGGLRGPAAQGEILDFARPSDVGLAFVIPLPPTFVDGVVIVNGHASAKLIQHVAGIQYGRETIITTDIRLPGLAKQAGQDQLLLESGA